MMRRLTPVVCRLSPPLVGGLFRRPLAFPSPGQCGSADSLFRTSDFLLYFVTCRRPLSAPSLPSCFFFSMAIWRKFPLLLHFRVSIHFSGPRVGGRDSPSRRFPLSSLCSQSDLRVPDPYSLFLTSGASYVRRLMFSCVGSPLPTLFSVTPVLGAPP